MHYYFIPDSTQDTTSVAFSSKPVYDLLPETYNDVLQNPETVSGMKKAGSFDCYCIYKSVRGVTVSLLFVRAHGGHFELMNSWFNV